MSSIVSFFWSGRQKQALMVWLAVYPTITGLVWALEPVLNDMVMPLRTLLLSVLMVLIMVYGAMPLINIFVNTRRS